MQIAGIQQPARKGRARPSPREGALQGLCLEQVFRGTEAMHLEPTDATPSQGQARPATNGVKE